MHKDKLAYGLFFLFLSVFIIVASKGLATAQPGDENVYYYMGRLVSEGKIPYKDFFFAHPPFQVYLIALIYKIFGFNIIALKFIPLISTLMTSFFIFKITKEKFGNVEAVASSLLFLFSYSIMFNSVFSFGIELATMFLVIGIYLLWNRNSYMTAGLFFGLAGISRLLSLAPIAIIFIVILQSNKKNFLKLSSAFFIVFLLVNGIFVSFLGNDYLTPVYKFHLLKKFVGKENLREYLDIVKLNWILFSYALSFIFIKDKKPISMFVITSITYLVFLATLKKIFGFYFMVIFPFLAIIGGYSIAWIYKNVGIQKKFKIIALAILSLIFAWNLASDILFLEKIGFAGFERGKDLADFVNSEPTENALLFGDDSVVPLLALLTNKNIALDFVDTNDEVFLSGLRDLGNVLDSLKGNDVLFIIRSRQGISYFKEVRQFLDNNCDFLSQFHDKIEGSYLVYRCS